MKLNDYCVTERFVCKWPICVELTYLCWTDWFWGWKGSSFFVGVRKWGVPRDCLLEDSHVNSERFYTIETSFLDILIQQIWLKKHVREHAFGRSRFYTFRNLSIVGKTLVWFSIYNLIFTEKVCNFFEVYHHWKLRLRIPNLPRRWRLRWFRRFSHKKWKGQNLW